MSVLPTALTAPRMSQRRGDLSRSLREPGAYHFKLQLEEATVEDFGFFDRVWQRGSGALEFERELKFYDARAFTTGTLPMFAKDWKSAVRP